MTQEPEEPEEGVRALPDGQGFAKDGVEYRIGDCLYVHPDCFDAVPPPAALLCSPKALHADCVLRFVSCIASHAAAHCTQQLAGEHQQALRPGQPVSHRTLVLMICGTRGYVRDVQVEDADGEAVAVPAYAAKSRYHKGGSNMGLRAWGICRLLSLKAASKKACTAWPHVPLGGLCKVLCMSRLCRSHLWGTPPTNSGTARCSYSNCLVFGCTLEVTIRGR